MTYEELLADIDSKNYRESRTLETPYIALRAAVEIHKPKDFEFNDEVVQICGHCQMGILGDQYPCETIAAIEKELV